MREYNAKDAALEIEKFVNDLSTWFIRRSRDRIWLNSEDENDKQDFYQNLHFIFVNLSIILSPFTPFISEMIYTNLIDEESVHLASWPKVDKKISIFRLKKKCNWLEKWLKQDMQSENKESKGSIPLARLEIDIESDVSQVSDGVWDIVLKELNVKIYE